MVFNAIFNNISAISWRTVLDLLVEDKSYTYTNESSIRIKKYIAKLKKKTNKKQRYMKPHFENIVNQITIKMFVVKNFWWVG